MSYKEKPQIKLYKYENSAFVLQAIIDDYAECSFENNRYSAGQFSITINYNIPNALKFERGLWVQFGKTPYAFGEILNIADSIGEDGKGSQLRIITGYDARYIFKRRIIKSLNNVENWSMTAKGEICMRNLIKDQCGSGAEIKRQLPIANIIPDPADAIGKSYSVSESFSNLYEVLVTIATQSEIGWRLNFSGSLSLEFYAGEDRHSTVRFDTDFESLANGEFKDSAEAFANTVYVGGKGTGNDRDIYEGESAIEGSSPAGLDRFEAWDNQSGMTTESEYEAEATSMLNQYGQTLQVSGQGLAKCPYEYGKEYNVGDIITIAFSGKSAIVQILSITEHWSFGAYDLQFSFGKPQPDLNKQLQLILKQIQKASNKTSSTDSVRWYTIPTDIEMPSSDVTYNTIGFIGNCASGGSTFKLYLDNEKTGAKTYHVYFKQLGGGKLTLTTGKTGATDLVMNSGTYVAIIYVDALGNVSMAGASVTNLIESGNNQPASSNAVYQAIQSSGSGIEVYDTDQDIIDDLPNLHSGDIVASCSQKDIKTGVPLGTWASFVNDSAPNGEWLESGSTFNANTYPALAMMLGGNTVPQKYAFSDLDYLHATEITPTSTTYTISNVDFNGIIIASLTTWNGWGNASYVEITRNGVTKKLTSSAFDGGTGTKASITFPVKKGDSVKFYMTTTTNSQIMCIPFEEHPMFIKATPTSSDTDYQGTLNGIRTYVSNSNSYSTEEVATGGKWIDGKPIYRKVTPVLLNSVLAPNITQNGNQYSFGGGFAINSETVVSVVGVELSVNEHWMTVTNAGTGIYLVLASDTTVIYSNGGISCKDLYAIIEYTKTN